MEEVPASHVHILRNLYSMVKKGGYLLCTFDLPGLQLSEIESELGVKYQQVTNEIHGNNSVFIENHYAHLTSGKLLIQK